MLNIYLTNLGKYNEGELVGEWVELPVSDEELEAVKSRIGINDYYEEMFITDYESDVDGLTVGEYDDIDELNALAEAIEDNPEAAAALIYNGYYSAEEIADHIDDVVRIPSYSSMSDEECVGYYYAEDLGGLENADEFLKQYFDYKRYGREIMLSGKFYKAQDGTIYEVIA